MPRTLKAPNRIWIQLHNRRIQAIAAYNRDPREVHDNGKPVYQFAHLDPIRKALEACRPHDDKDGFVSICKDDWEAIRDAINK